MQFIPFSVIRLQGIYKHEMFSCFPFLFEEVRELKHSNAEEY